MLYALPLLSLLLPVLARYNATTTTPLVSKRDIGASLSANVGLCVKLSSDLKFNSAAGTIGAGAKVDAGACVCANVHADTGVVGTLAALTVAADVDTYVELHGGAVGQVGGSLGSTLARDVSLLCRFSPNFIN